MEKTIFQFRSRFAVKEHKSQSDAVTHARPLHIPLTAKCATFHIKARIKRLFTETTRRWLPLFPELAFPRLRTCVLLGHEITYITGIRSKGGLL